jgi:hypothetical protein
MQNLNVRLIWICSELCMHHQVVDPTMLFLTASSAVFRGSPAFNGPIVGLVQRQRREIC